MLGISDHDCGLYRDAMAASGTACRLEPENPENWLVHARASYVAGAPQRALEEIGKAFALDPDQPTDN